MSDLNVHMCPETGICSNIKPDGNKIDLISDEVNQVREASGDPDAVRQVLAQIDPGFATGLDSGEIAKLSNELDG